MEASEPMIKERWDKMPQRLTAYLKAAGLEPAAPMDTDYVDGPFFDNDEDDASGVLVTDDDSDTDEWAMNTLRFSMNVEQLLGGRKA